VLQLRGVNKQTEIEPENSVLIKIQIL